MLSFLGHGFEPEAEGRLECRSVDECSEWSKAAGDSAYNLYNERDNLKLKCTLHTKSIQLLSKLKTTCQEEGVN